MSCGMKTRALLGSCLLLATTTAAAAESTQLGTDDYSTFAFVPNGGQFRADVAFVARTPTNQIFVLADGRIVHALPIASTAAESISAWVVLEELPGAATRRAGRASATSGSPG